jgi:twitching motility protein PilJ
MVKSSIWAKLLPPLGVLLAVLLLATAVALWLGGRNAPTGGSDRLGPLLAVAQAARVDAREALTGDPAALAALRVARDQVQRELTAVRSGVTDDRTTAFLAAEEWMTLTSGLDSIVASGDALEEFGARRQQLQAIVPDLLSATANFAAVLPAADLRTNQIHLERFELTAQSVQQSARALATPGAIGDSLRALGDAEQFLGQIISGLEGQDSALGIAPVRDAAAADDLDELTTRFGAVRDAIGAISVTAGDLQNAEGSLAASDSAAAALLTRYQALDPGGATPSEAGSGLPFLLLGLAIVVMALILLAYYRARDFRRAAELQAEQNERNQQAILRLLDELSNLADGDLTVQATVTEDITGAIADSINYAIEALRELVATVNDSSILVDSAAKQTEATAQHLVRSSETQAKQAAAASDSVAKMTTSVAEVSGNAERCADVARHAVDVAHKGGDAVRRTIEGMNTIRETIQDTSKRIKRLGESSQEIGNIVELIEEIAEQTNILALNASIEASRAGEASRGFAVVADEVQKLAERSTAATKKIEVLVSTIQSDTNEAVVSMERSTTDVVGGALLAENAGAALDEIEQVSHQIASLVQNISNSARDQRTVSTAINKNMQVLRQISAKTTESTAATSSAISRLSELASQLRRTVRGFRLPDQVTATGILTPAQVAESLIEDSGSGTPEPSVPGTESIGQRRRSG